MSFPWPDAAHIAVAGEIDMMTAPILGLRLLAALEHRQPMEMQVDLTAVGFMDCAGIGMLVTVYAAAARTGCRVRLTGAVGPVARVLDLTGVGMLFAAPVSPAEAIAPYAACRPSGRDRRVVIGQAM